MSTLQDQEQPHIMPTHQQGETAVFKDVTNPTKYIKATVLSIPLDDEDDTTYTVQDTMTGDIHEIQKAAVDSLLDRPKKGGLENEIMTDLKDIREIQKLAARP